MLDKDTNNSRLTNLQSSYDVIEKQVNVMNILFDGILKKLNKRTTD